MVQWATVFQSVGQLLREFESGMHEKLIENASADVREAIRSLFSQTPFVCLYCTLLYFCRFFFCGSFVSHTSSLSGQKQSGH